MRGEVLYTVSTLRMAVYLGHDPDPYTVMLNNGVEINMIHSSIAAKLGLVVTQLNHRLMTSTNQLKSKFLGIVEDTPVSISSFQYWVPFFMVEGWVSHNYILRQPFKVQTLLGYQYKENGSVTVTMKSPDRKRKVSIPAFSITNKCNCHQEDMFDNED